MKVRLKDLSDGFQSLSRLASAPLEKGQFKLAYQLARKFRSAKAEIEDLVAVQEKMMLGHGFSKYDLRPDQPASPELAEKIAAYNEEASAHLRETFVEIWGDLIPLSQVEGVIDLSPADLGLLLGWLITETEEEAAKAASSKG